MSGYPAEWEFDALLSDGATIHVRPITPDDAPALVALHSRLSPQTVYRRFFSPRPVLPDADVRRFTNVDHHDRFALVGILDGELSAVARYDRTGRDEAEVAFVVEDRHQGRGVGMLLLEHLAAAARERGVRRFVAETLVDNAAMLGVFRAAGFPLERSHADGVVRLAFPVEETGTALAAMEGREHRAEVASMRRLLRPRAVAVVGAGRQPGGLGHEIVRHLVTGGYRGPVHSVNRAGPGHDVAGVPAVASVADLPGPVDLAVVAVPAGEVPGVVEACGAAGVGAVVVVSAGFSEAGPAGEAAERDLVRLARRSGVRLVGPGSLGVRNAAPAVALDATVAPAAPPPGPVALLTQSGALGIAVLRRAADVGLGLSSFVSLGNKADVSGNDLLQYWEADPATAVVLVHLRSFGNPRKFARIARRVARTKPIVAVHPGTGGTGGAGTGGEAGALFHQAGVIRVDTLEEMFDVALVLANQPVPAGNRLAVLASAGGPGALAAAACPAAGLQLAELAPATRDALAPLLPAGLPVANPVELVGPVGADQVTAAARALAADPGVDALVLGPAPAPSPTAGLALVTAVARAAASERPGCPVVVTAPGVGPAPGVLPGTSVPAFPFPEQAVRALGRVASYGRWLARPEGEVPDLPGVDRDAAVAAAAAVLASAPGGRWLSSAEAAGLLGCYGVPVAASAVVATADEAADAAAAIGFPVAVKAAPAGIPHRTDVGAVHLGLTSPGDARRAFASVVALGGGQAVVQAMVPAGVATVVEVAQHPSFGPLVTFGVGGLATDLLGDRASRILPLTDLDAAELVRSVRAAPLLFGYRGAPAADVDALADLLLRVARLAQEVPEVAEAVLDPVIASSGGAVAVDVRARLHPAPPGPGPLLRRLR